MTDNVKNGGHMKKILLIALVSFSTMAQEPAPVQAPEKSVEKKLSGISLFLGMDLRNEVKLDGSAAGQSYSAAVDLSAPNFLIGIGYEGLLSKQEKGDWYLGARITRNLDQDGDKITETLGSTTSTSNNKVKFKTTSIYLTGAYKFDVGDYKYGVGALVGSDVVAVSGLNSSFAYDISNGATFGVIGSIQKDHIKGEVQIKSTTGDMTARGLGSISGTNISGEYKYTSMVFLIGYEF